MVTSTSCLASDEDQWPAVARPLNTGRDLVESFDFLTWPDFSEESAPQFDELLMRFPVTEECRYFERKAEARLRRASSRQRHANWETS
jgi:hypothetical protein